MTMLESDSGPTDEAAVILDILRRQRGARDAARDLPAVVGIMVIRWMSMRSDRISHGQWAAIRRGVREWKIDPARLTGVLNTTLRAITPLASPTTFEPGMAWLPDVFAEIERDDPERFHRVAAILVSELSRSGNAHTGEHDTPIGLANLLAALTVPRAKHRVFDPACSSGAPLAAAVRFVGADKLDEVAGRALNPMTRDLAEFSLLLHGQTLSDVRLAGAALPAGRAHVILSNPHFVIDGGPATLVRDALNQLAPSGRAAFVLPAALSASRRKDDVELRRLLVESGALQAVIALPPDLFADTRVAPHVMVFTTAQRGSGTDDLRPIHLIDASRLGTLLSKTNRVLTDEDVEKLAKIFHDGRQASSNGEGRSSASGIVASAIVTAQQLQQGDYVLTPARHLAREAASPQTQAPTTDPLLARLSDIGIEAADLERQLSDRIELWRQSPSSESRHQSLIGPVPSSWGRMKLSELLGTDARGDGGKRILTGPAGQALVKSDYVDDGVPVIMPRDIGDNVLSCEQANRVDAWKAQQLAAFGLRTGDIVLARRGEMGRRALVGPDQEGWLIGTGCIRVRCGEDVDAGYLAAYLGLREVRAWLSDHAQGTTALLSMSARTLGDLEIVYPPRNVREAIRDAEAAATRRIALANEAAVLASNLRQAVMAEIMAG